VKKFYTCNVSSISSPNKDGSLNTIPIASVGKWKGHVNGEFELTIKELEQIQTNFNNSSLDVVVDLDHATLFKGTGEAYGWIKELEIVDAKLNGKVEWLENGKELVKSKKYKYISPVLSPNTIDEVTAENIGWTLHSVALTNRPFFEELGEIKINNKKEKKGEVMTPEEKAKMDGLESQVTTLTKDLETEKNKSKDLETKVTALEDELAKAKDTGIESQVDAAITANKVSSTQKESLIALGKSNPESLKAFLENAKVQVAAPDNDMFAANNNQQQNQKIDVLKLGGIN
jgi:phage I-like protein